MWAGRLGLDLTRIDGNYMRTQKILRAIVKFQGRDSISAGDGGLAKIIMCKVSLWYMQRNVSVWSVT
jgi:hypothetical protein